MDTWDIIIPARKREPVSGQQVVRVSAEAYNALTEIYNESSISMKEIASLLILEAAKHVRYMKED